MTEKIRDIDKNGYTTKQWPIVKRYKRWWFNLGELVEVTTNQGAKVITNAIERLEQMLAEVGLSGLPFMAILPNMITLWYVFSPIMDDAAAASLVGTIEILPLVLSFNLFRTKKSSGKQTLQNLLTSYYLIIFLMTFAYKVLTDNGITVASAAWLLLPSISVVAMLSYGKIKALQENQVEIDSEVIKDVLQISLFSKINMLLFSNAHKWLDNKLEAKNQENKSNDSSERITPVSKNKRNDSTKANKAKSRKKESKSDDCIIDSEASDYVKSIISKNKISSGNQFAKLQDVWSESHARKQFRLTKEAGMIYLNGDGNYHVAKINQKETTI